MQGKVDVASLWCIVSHTILTAHSSLHKPIVIQGATKECKIVKNNDAFVDDTYGYAEAKTCGRDLEKEAVEYLQRKAQSWARLIAVLGGEIAFHKCMWKVIGWKYKKFPPTLKTKSKYKVKLTNRGGVHTEISQLPIDHPNVGLGCRLAPYGNQKHECSFRLNQ